MIEFNTSDDEVEMIFTLTEHVSVNDPIFNFVFTHVLTGDTVEFSKTSDQDESDNIERYNAFTVSTSLFERIGEYHYEVFEDQTDLSLEKGKLLVNRDFNFTKYNGTTSYKVYGG